MVALEPEADGFPAALEPPLATDFAMGALEPMGGASTLLTAFVAALEPLGGGAVLLLASEPALGPGGD